MHQNQRFSKSMISQLFSEYVYCILAILAMMTLLLSNNAVFAADSVFKPLTPPNSLPNECPSDHKKYSITNTGAVNSKTSISAWAPGSSSKEFTFEESSGNKVFKIQFSGIVDKNNSDGSVPFYGSNSGVTTNALNMVHNSTGVKTNHVLDISVNRSVSKIGYKIQDIDSTGSNNNIPYIEQVDVSNNNGRLTFKSDFHIPNNPAPNTTIVTGIEGRNCASGGCNIDASWNYNLADTALNLKHNNTKRDVNGIHALGYSDFYFCLAPPKLLIKKQLNGTRVNDTTINLDQFSISINNGATTVGSFDTLGSGQTVTNNSGAVALAQSTTYTITERVINNQNNGDIANYNASYTCSNATTGSTTVMPTAAMTYDAAAKTRSFTLANTNYGDEITCTITNTPSVYTFSGTVFNDNGGLTLESNKVGVVNSAYFNGEFDPTAGEAVISNSNVTVNLTDCSLENNLIANTSPQLVSSVTGKYNFYIPKDSLAVGKTVCLVENEPAEWEYSVDTTTNKRKVIITPDKYTYDNLDFGEVKVNNTALVLIKSQYVHDCNATLDYSDSAINQTNDNPRIGFSDQPVSDVAPNQCIAYRIEAYNRGHVELNDVQIRDELTSNKSSFTNPTPKGVPTNIYGTTMPTAKVITSNTFNLAASAGSSTKATLYFNTKYRTTVNP